jgi:hypothetical protein
MIPKLFGSIAITVLSASITISSFAQIKRTLLHKPGQTFKDCASCPEMVVIPPGNCMMGSTVEELGNNVYTPYLLQSERPQREVRIQQFACGKYLGIVGEMEKTQIKERQVEGINLAKLKGVYKGRVEGSKEDIFKFLGKEQNKKTLELLKKGYKAVEISKITGVHINTITKIKKLGLQSVV